MSDQQAQIVYTDLKDGSAVQGKLFDGLKFWIAMRCPMRSSFIEQIKSNGGQIVPLEKHADHLIADHARKDNPPGSISYRFIEQSVRNGVLEDPEDHLAGPPAGEIREVASARPTKGTRNPFTPDEDRQLYKWAKDHERKGGRVLGNEIYKQLEAVNPSHPWQSWRDRYVKYLSVKPPSGFDSDHVPSSPLAGVASDPGSSNVVRTKVKATSSPGQARRPNVSAETTSHSGGFTAKNFNDLIDNGKRMQNVLARHLDTAWHAWTEAQDASHDATEWYTFWKTIVLPVFEEMEDQEHRSKSYKMLWQEWNLHHPRGSAEEWLAFYETQIRPNFTKQAAGTVQGAEGDERAGKRPDVDSGPSTTPKRPSSPHAASVNKHSVSPTAQILHGRTSAAILPVTGVVEIAAAASNITQTGKETIILSSDAGAASADSGGSSDSDEDLPPFPPPRKRPREDEIQETPTKFMGPSEIKRQKQEGSIDIEISHQTSSLVSQQVTTTVLSTKANEIVDISESQESAANGAQDNVDNEMDADVDDSAHMQEHIRQRTDLPDLIVAAALAALDDEQKAELLGRVQHAPDNPELVHVEPREEQQVVTVEEEEEQMVAGGTVARVKRTTRVSFAEPLEEVESGDEDVDSEELGTGQLAIHEAVVEDEDEPLFVRARSRSRSISFSSQPPDDDAVPNDALPGLHDQVPAADTELDMAFTQGNRELIFSSPPVVSASVLAQAATTLDTQAILDAETQIPDLALAEPQGGFDEDEPEEEEEELHEGELAGPSHEMEAEEEAEDESVQDDPTDLTVVPLPDGGFADPKSADPADPAAPVPNPPNAANGEHMLPPQPQPTLQTFIDAFLAAGHAAADVVTALKATSTNVELAEAVIASLEAGQGVSESVKGVWTERDDRDVESGDGRNVQRVAKKHGWEGPGGVEGRIEFLRRWRNS